MQYKNPVDIELVQAAQEAYDTLMRIHEYIGSSPDTTGTLRLKNALHIAKAQMQAEEEAARGDFTFAVDPPASMD